MGDTVRRLDEHDAAGAQRAVHVFAVADAFFLQYRHQFLVVALGVTGVRTDEEAGAVVLDPGSELVQLAIDRIEQENAADAVGDAADLEAPGRRQEAAAVADDHDRHAGERFCRIRIAIEAGEMSGRFIHEALEAVRLPEFSGAGIGGVDRELRRQQHGIDAGIGDLLRHHLAVAHVAFERGAVAVEEHHDHAGFSGVEMLGHVHQHAAVVVGLVLPVDFSGITAVTAAIALGDVEEWRLGARIVAEIGEGRGFHADQRGQVFFRGRPRERKAGSDRCDAIGRAGRFGPDGFRPHRALTRRPLQALAFGREAVPELRRGEAVLERVAGCMRIRSQCPGGRRLAALSQQQRQRDNHREKCDRSQIARCRRPDIERRARHCQACTITHQEFRIRSDHPPIAPRSSERVSELTGVRRR